ncbi:MAG: hypothetical protein JNK76_23285 [Planctomycetales bacterium]|nr:hypothetical protein [Planctomycetales bacterium]
MTPFVTPPTDNLYKFTAIAGLVLFVVCVIVPLQLLRDFQTAPSQESALLGAEVIDGVIALKLVSDDDLKKLVPAPSTTTVSFEHDEDRRERDNERRAFLAVIEERIFDRLHVDNPAPTTQESAALKALRANVLKYEIHTYDDWAFYESFSYTMRWTDRGRSLSLWMMLIGFVLWWRRVQRWHDRTLAAEANKSPPAAKKQRALFSRLASGARSLSNR